ncbi:hypothetical protein ABZ547_09260 [Streptomyces sparsogenes]|uniref:hypothetical protein n=1 Tax=Streptomyces sparsogenes TaxID=67365 RepID=UPI0033DCF5B8
MVGGGRRHGHHPHGIGLRERRGRAGLPTDPERVGELWPTWEKFTEAGEKFRAEVKDASFTANTGDIWVGK